MLNFATVFLKFFGFLKVSPVQFFNDHSQDNEIFLLNDGKILNFSSQFVHLSFINLGKFFQTNLPNKISRKMKRRKKKVF